MIILAPEEVLKQLVMPLPDTGSGDQEWTFMWSIPSHAPKMSPWSDFNPLYTFEVLLWHGHIPQRVHHAQSGFGSQCSPHAQSSYSGEGMAQASLNQDEALEDDFQTQHMPVHRIMQLEDNGHRSSAEGGMEYSGGSLR